MPRSRAWFIAVVASLISLPGGGVQAQLTSRPVPYPLTPSVEFGQAVARGTRTRDGAPGPRYWQQRAEYRLEATLDPVRRLLTGAGRVRYHNRSPDTLRTVWFHLHQNLFAPEAVRNEVVPVTGGMTLTSVVAGGQALTAGSYRVDGTRMAVSLPVPLLPGSSTEFVFRWSFAVPPEGAPRGGTDGEVFFLSYWYPQVAVYDDVVGWQVDPYMGNAEFYMGFADYDVALTVPAGWLIGATGTLGNPEEVLGATTLSRLRAAAATRDIVPIVTEQDWAAGTATARSTAGTLTWRFSARDVRDFAFGTSARYRWDATTAVVGSGPGQQRAMIHTFYRPERTAWAWDRSARYAQHSIEFLSGYLWPYPYPQATAMDGVVSCAGMEYPMITCIGGERDTVSLYSVTVHELAHMWFPMQVGSDEKRHAWMDEGITRFNQAQGMRAFFNGYDREPMTRDSYLRLAQGATEEPLMRHGDRYAPDTPAYAVASYDKMATNLASLRGLVGERRLLAALREYGERWRGRHPTAWDFFLGMNASLGQDLGWFWRTWWFETWTLDHAIAEVHQEGDSLAITIEDRGLAPMPTPIVVRRTDGSAQRYEIPVTTWLAGGRRSVFRVRAQPAVASVELDPDRLFPDVDRGNQLWRNLPR